MGSADVGRCFRNHRGQLGAYGKVSAFPSLSSTFPDAGLHLSMSGQGVAKTGSFEDWSRRC